MASSGGQDTSLDDRSEYDFLCFMGMHSSTTAASLFFFFLDFCFKFKKSNSFLLFI
jgi:hypothetical protein